MTRQKIDDRKVIEVYNASGSKVAKEFMSTEYHVLYPYSIITRLRRDTANAYDKSKDKFLCIEESPFLRLDELCTVSDNELDIPKSKTVDNGSSNSLEWIANVEFKHMLQELAMEKLLEMTKYISLNHATGQCKINKHALDSAGYQVEIY